MTRPEKIILSFALCCFYTSSWAQDLRKAVTDHYITKNFPFEKELILNNKIKQLEKHHYVFSDDTLFADILIDQYQFNKNGGPEYEYHKQVGGDKREIYYKYDNQGQLVKKEIYGISPGLKYKLIEWYDWFYTNGFLTKQSRYLLIDKIPIRGGTTGFPEMYFLYTNDTILYNYKDTTCLIIQNNPEHFKHASFGLYPPHYQHKINTTLKFHSNNTLYSETVKVDSTVRQYTYDLCGNPPSDIVPDTECLLRLAGNSKCMARNKIRICNDADTATLNNQLVYINRSKGIVFQHDSGPGTFIVGKSISYYNTEFEILKSIDSTSYIPGDKINLRPSSVIAPAISPSDFPGDEVNQAFLSEFRTTLIRIHTYEYFDFGLLKKVSVKDENGKLIEVDEFKIEYYE